MYWGNMNGKKDAALAKETGGVYTWWPLSVKAGRNRSITFKPVYRNDDSGESSFWGFVLQVIDWGSFHE